MGTMSVPSKTLCLTSEVANGDFCSFFLQKETGTERVAMATAPRVSFLFFRCTFVVPSFNKTASINYF